MQKRTSVSLATVLLPARAMVVLAWAAVIVSLPAARIDRYVWGDSPSPGEPYDTWDNAAHDIQTAIEEAVAAEGDEVVVRAGIYETGGYVYHGLTNRVYIGKNITVRSELNDPLTTIIKGAQDPLTTNGPAAIRPVQIESRNAQLIGFTITGGATLGVSGSQTATRCGGGIYLRYSTAIASNCVVAGNSAQSYSGHGGGGVWGGTLYDCVIRDNGFANNPSHAYGGGAYDSTLYRCDIFNNMSIRGGGAYNSTLYNCIISNNVATGGYGGGVSYSEVFSSTLASNTATSGGGAAWSSMVDCIIASNHVANFGSAAYSDHNAPTPMLNCRVLYNTGGGGSLYRTHTTNSIIIGSYDYAAQRPAALVNCLIVGNDAGIIIDQTWEDLWRIENCTIVGNGKRGLNVTTGNVLSRNNIIYDNQNHNWQHSGGTLVFENTCTTPAQSGWDASNIDADPKFIEAGSGYGSEHIAGNYGLRGDSPCLNKGQITEWMEEGTVELAGNPRIDKLTGIPDMGCYELVYSGSAILIR